MDFLPMPPYDELSQCINYDPVTGLGTWLKTLSPAALSGSIVGGSRNSSGYMQFQYQKKRYLTHRVFWFLQTCTDPKNLEIDHIDGNKINNKFSNLRLASSAQNSHNWKISRQNKSGCRGVCLDKKSKKWRAYIMFYGKQIHIGMYFNFEQAVAARQAKELELYGFSPLHQLNND
jgi:hypothetical protein